MSSLFHPGREGFLTGEIVWKPSASVIKASLLRGYTYNNTHKFVSQVTGGGGTIVATVTLTNLTFANGVAGADNLTYTAIPEGDPIPHILLYQASAVTGGADLATTAQRLIGLIDQASGLPCVPNGEDINVSWSPGADRIFRL
jgi:hypothetical protein